MDERFQRRCSATKHDRHAPLLRTPDRQIAAVIANTVLLLELRIVLFVDNDEREPRQRREHGESSTQD